MNKIDLITANMPPDMPDWDRAEYMQTQKEITELERSGLNAHRLESLRNYAFRLITPYIILQFSDI